MRAPLSAALTAVRRCCEGGDRERSAQVQVRSRGEPSVTDDSSWSGAHVETSKGVSLHLPSRATPGATARPPRSWTVPPSPDRRLRPERQEAGRQPGTLMLASSPVRQPLAGCGNAVQVEVSTAEPSGAASSLGENTGDSPFRRLELSAHQRSGEDTHVVTMRI